MIHVKRRSTAPRKLLSLQYQDGEMTADVALRIYKATSKMDPLIINRMSWEERQRFYRMVNDENKKTGSELEQSTIREESADQPEAEAVEAPRQQQVPRRRRPLPRMPAVSTFNDSESRGNDESYDADQSEMTSQLKSLSISTFSDWGN